MKLLNNNISYIKLSEEYEKDHHLIIDNLFHSIFLNTLLNITRDETNFKSKNWEGIGSDSTLSNPELSFKLNFLFNSKEFIDFGKRILNNNQITKTQNRLFYLDNTYKEGLTWHTDASKIERYGAIRIDLTEEAIAGGTFQFRNKKTKEVLFSIPSMRLNQACLFKIDKNQYEHRVLPVISNRRVSLIIWFE
jgi:hypothetical protein